MENNWKKINLIKKLENVSDYYIVNQDGQVKRIAYTYTDKNGVNYNKKEKILNPILDRDTTARISINTKDKRSLNISVGYIVASLFVDNPNNYTSIDYIDGNPHNYKFNNLKWVDATIDPLYDVVEPLEGEIWKSIKDFSNYKVSNLGRVKSLPRNSYQTRDGYYTVPKKSQLISPILEERSGYYIVGLSHYDNRAKIVTKRIHRLVAETFIPNPDNLPQVDHINHNKSDNSVNNLRWVTSKENCLNGGTTKIEITFPNGNKEIVNSVDEAQKLSGYSIKGITQHCINESKWVPGNFGFRYAEKSYQTKIGQISRREIKNIKEDISNKIISLGYELDETKNNDKIHIKGNNFPYNMVIKNCSTTPNYFNIKSTISDSTKPFGIYWKKTTTLNENVEPIVFMDATSFFKLMKIYKLVKDKNPKLVL